MTELETRTLERLREDTAQRACADFLAAMDELHFHEILTALAFDRLRYKMRLVETLREECSGDWNQTFYQLYFRTLGDSNNQDAFVELARRVPYKTVLRERTMPHAVEAMLAGTSGLLNLYELDAYRLDLLRTYEHLAAKYALEPMEVSAWNLVQIRPANHPLLRIVQAAEFFVQDEFLMNRTMECRTRTEIQRLFGVDAPTYWNVHCLPDANDDPRPKRIGAFKSRMLGINLVAVLQFAYGSYTDDESLHETALKLLETIPPEKNSLTEKWCKQHVPRPKNAFESQALIQLSKSYCRNKRCDECPVARRILHEIRRTAAAEE